MCSTRTIQQVSVAQGIWTGAEGSLDPIHWSQQCYQSSLHRGLWATKGNSSPFPWEAQGNASMQFQKSILILKTVPFSWFSLFCLNSQPKVLMGHHLCTIALLQKHLKLINDVPLKKAVDLFLICLLEWFFVLEKHGAFLGGVAEEYIAELHLQKYSCVCPR